MSPQQIADALTQLDGGPRAATSHEIREITRDAPTAETAADWIDAAVAAEEVVVLLRDENGFVTAVERPFKGGRHHVPVSAYLRRTRWSFVAWSDAYPDKTVLSFNNQGKPIPDPTPGNRWWPTRLYIAASVLSDMLTAAAPPALGSGEAERLAVVTARQQVEDFMAAVDLTSARTDTSIRDGVAELTITLVGADAEKFAATITNLAAQQAATQAQKEVSA